MTDWTFDPSRYEGHTPGPWRTCSSNDGGLGVWDGGSVVADIRGIPAIHGPLVSANAHLIADAPHLLREVERLRAREGRLYALVKRAAKGRCHRKRGGDDPAHECPVWHDDKPASEWCTPCAPRAAFDALVEAVERAELDVRAIYKCIDQDREVKAMKRAGQVHRDLIDALASAEEALAPPNTKPALDALLED